MSDKDWQTIRNFDQARLRAARLQAHFAVQWLARAAYAYVPAQPADDHSTLGWDDKIGGFLTHVLTDGAQLGLRLADLTLMLVARANAADMFPLNNRSDADVRAWLGPLMAARGLAPDALDKPLPYRMPELRIGSEQPYAAKENAVGLAEHAVWFANANAALELARHEYVRHLAAPPVRCWPHHFDLDSLVTVRPGHTVGIGYEPGDHYYDEPYFYVSVNPKSDIATLPTPPSIAHWHGKGFTAAVATAARIMEVQDQKAAVETYLKFSIETAIKVLVAP